MLSRLLRLLRGRLKIGYGSFSVLVTLKGGRVFFRSTGVTLSRDGKYYKKFDLRVHYFNGRFRIRCLKIKIVDLIHLVTESILRTPPTPHPHPPISIFIFYLFTMFHSIHTLLHLLPNVLKLREVIMTLTFRTSIFPSLDLSQQNFDVNI